MNLRLTRRHQRLVKKRIIVRGILELETPACFSSGDAEADTDLPLLRDTVNNKALLLGSSIAGALRSYLENYKPNAQLFGVTRQKTEGVQSPLIVEDALSKAVIKTELRDGVKIDGETRTASDEAKYDLELLQAGTQFDLGFELLVDPKTENGLKEELAIALHGLEEGHIPIGMKKHRGFGQCHVQQWQIWEFDLTNDTEREAWLLFNHQRRSLHDGIAVHQYVSRELKNDLVVKKPIDICSIEAKFTLASPLLIRSGQHDQSKAPDVVHLKSSRNNGIQPIISGTSLAGILRHRAVKILKTLDLDFSIVDEIFGTEKKASRLTVQESVVENTTDLVQNRIAIDRFTGGALDGALFSEQIICSSPETQVILKLQLKKATNPEIGLLLLLMKDLWTGDLTIGGGSSIGRGRLQGQLMTIFYQEKVYTIEQSGEILSISDPNALEYFVSNLSTSLRQEASV